MNTEDIVHKIEYCPAYDTTFSEPAAIGISIFVAFFLCLMWIILRQFLSVKKVFILVSVINNKEFLDVPNIVFHKEIKKKFFGLAVYDNGEDYETNTFCKIVTNSYRETNGEIIIM